MIQIFYYYLEVFIEKFNYLTYKHEIIYYVAIQYIIEATHLNKMH